MSSDFGASTVGSTQAAAAGALPVSQCAELDKLTVEGNTIAAAELVANGSFTTPAGQTLSGLPEFCRTVDVSKPSADSNINFEVWLPPTAFQSNIYCYRAWMARLLSVPGASLSAGKLSTTQAAAVAACDKLDGAADGLIEDPRKCTFDPAALLCTADDNDKCLTAAQVDFGPGPSSFGGIGQQIPRYATPRTIYGPRSRNGKRRVRLQTK